MSTTVDPAAKVSTTTSSVTDAATIAQVKQLNTLAGSGSGTYGSPEYTAVTGTTTVGAGLSVTTEDINGNKTVTTYTALDANGMNSTADSNVTVANAASYAVSTTVTTSATGLLTQNGTDLTQLGSSTGTTISESNAASALAAVNQALAAVQNYSGYVGATQDRLTAASTFNSALTTDYSNGVAGLVDADMNTASTQLQALQTQEQLGIQSLSIANQNSQLILKLFSSSELPARRFPSPR